MKKLLDKVYGKPTQKEVDELWSILIKLRAGNKSELSGKTEGLNSHHLRGKSCRALRYSLDNGFCCTKGEHFFGFHHISRYEDYEGRVKLLRGKYIFQKLRDLKKVKDSRSLTEIKEWLEGEINENNTPII